MTKIVYIPQLKRGVIYEKILEKGAWKKVVVKSYRSYKIPNENGCKSKVNNNCNNCSHKTTPRFCLPWENEKSVLQQDLNSSDKINFKSQDLIERLTNSICGNRRIAKCLSLFKDPKECQLNLEDIKIQKEYPFFHAAQKKYLPGCPSSNWTQMSKSSHNPNDNTC